MAGEWLFYIFKSHVEIIQNNIWKHLLLLLVAFHGSWAVCRLDRGFFVLFLRLWQRHAFKLKGENMWFCLVLKAKTGLQLQMASSTNWIPESLRDVNSGANIYTLSLQHIYLIFTALLTQVNKFHFVYTHTRNFCNVDISPATVKRAKQKRIDLCHLPPNGNAQRSRWQSKAVSNQQFTLLSLQCVSSLTNFM